MQQITDLIQTANLETTKAQTIQNAFKGFFDVAAQWETKAKTLTVTDATQVVEMKMAREARLFLKNKRVEVEKKRKELKENLILEGRVIDGIASVLTALIEPTEKYLEEQEKYAEIKEAERRAQLQADRETALKPYNVQTQFYKLGDMSEAEFQRFLEASKIAHQQQQEAQAKAEQERIEAQQKAEAEREAQRIENERLKKEAEEREAELKKAREAQAQAELKAKAEAAERQSIEAQQKAEKERIERERIAQQKAQAEAERKAKRAPDKVKMEAFAQKIADLESDYTFTSDDAKTLYSHIRNELSKLSERVKHTAQTW